MLLRCILVDLATEDRGRKRRRRRRVRSPPRGVDLYPWVKNPRARNDDESTTSSSSTTTHTTATATAAAALSLLLLMLRVYRECPLVRSRCTSLWTMELRRDVNLPLSITSLLHLSRPTGLLYTLYILSSVLWKYSATYTLSIHFIILSRDPSGLQYCLYHAGGFIGRDSEIVQCNPVQQSTPSRFSCAVIPDRKSFYALYLALFFRNLFLQLWIFKERLFIVIIIVHSWRYGGAWEVYTEHLRRFFLLLWAIQWNLLQISIGKFSTWYFESCVECVI